MSIEIVLHEDDFLGSGEVDIAQLFQNLRIVDGRAPLGDLDISPTLQWGEQHEKAGRAVALVFVVIARWLPRPSGQWCAGLGDQLF